MLAAERGLAVILAVASVAIGVVQLAEPILFGRVVDTLSGGGAAFPYIALWALLGCSALSPELPSPCSPTGLPIGATSPPWQRHSSGR